MGILEQVNQMKGEGATESQIISNLQEQGISPKIIEDALSQSQIQQAISPEQNLPTGVQAPGMSEPPMQEEMYAPTAQEMPPAQDVFTAPAQQEYSDQQIPQQGYQDEYQMGAPMSAGLDTDTIIEISEQVFSEKIKDLQIKIDKIAEFANLAKTRIENNQERLKRIESVMDKLQMNILDKVGSYGKDLDSIKKEISMVGNSYSKIVESFDRKHKK